MDNSGYEFFINKYASNTSNTKDNNNIINIMKNINKADIDLVIKSNYIDNLMAIYY